ncbi:MAG: M28 family peptidase, partial [Promethearchaeota archaeon]
NQSIDSIKSFILLDMVGGENLEFIQESHACPDLQEHLFNVGNHFGYGTTFPLDRNSYSIMDDHVPFAQIGVPTVVLIIKFWDLSNGWPYHHTQGDNITHISLESLEITGKTILYFIFFTFHPSRDIFPNGFSSPTYFQQNWPTIIIFSVGIISVVIYGIITLISRKKLKFRPFPKVTQENNQNKLQNKQKSKE